MAAPAGNSFGASTANSAESGTLIYDDITKLLTIVERISERQTAGVPGYTNNDIAWNTALLTYSNTGNFGKSSHRLAHKGSATVYNGNTVTQGVIDCIRTVLWANT